VYSNGAYKEQVIYRGLGAQNKFIECIRNEVVEIGLQYDEIEVMLPLAEEEQIKHDNNTKCEMCNKEYRNKVCSCNKCYL
jgi:hypothetical protein